MRDLSPEPEPRGDLGTNESVPVAPPIASIDHLAAMKAVLENLPDAAWLLDNESRILFANRDLPGVAVSPPSIGKSVFDVLPPAWHPLIQEGLSRAESTDEICRIELELDVTRDRRVFIECLARSLDDDLTGAVLILIFREATVEMSSTDETRIDAERYRFLTETISDVIWTMDLEQRITYVSASIKPVVGYEVEELESTALSELLAPESFALARETLLEELRLEADANQTASRIRTLDLKLVRKDGSTIWCEARMSLLRDSRGTPNGILGVARDISSWREAQEALAESEERLQRAQRLEAVGQLAGGIAHDFNNLLTVIIGNVELMLKELPAGDILLSHADEVSKAADRAASLTRQLLAFSRKQMMVPKVLDLNLVVREMSSMLKGLLGENIDLETSLSPDLGRVKADPSQMELALVNLAVNARDAMADSGRLVIETSNVHLDPTSGGSDFTVTEGPYVKLTVTDSGKGIAEKDQAKIFEPFFTTKEVGKGTGLGLSTVYGIVKQSNGYIWLHSRPGKGARFEICLPRIEADHSNLALGHASEQRANGTEAILLVEDEPGVRSLTKRILRNKGYQVDEAPGGEHAMEMLGDPSRHYDLLLSDVIMPGMSGATLAQKALVERPDLKILFISGHSDDMLSRHGRLDAPAHFLEKPFTSDGLSKMVREVLDSSSASIHG